MELLLRELVESLKFSSQALSRERQSLETVLHDTNSLPDKELASLASQALDLLSTIRLLLEPRHALLADQFLGYMNTKVLCAAVELNVPDILHVKPRTLVELADECNARPDRLEQVMRTLHNLDIFYYDSDTATYYNNTTSTLLLSNHWTQWRNWVDLYGNQFYEMARGIPDACKRNAVRSPAQISFDTDDNMFTYFNKKGWVHKLHKTLSGGAIAQSLGILQDYPWTDVSTSSVLDIGGGGGGLIALLLRQHKQMTGAILEIPRVIEQARFNFHDPAGDYKDVGDRIPPQNLVAGDFFQDIPPSEVYTMKWCLHDWDDEKSVAILRNIRKSLRVSQKSRLIILESVLADGHVGRISRYADLNMMVAVGGKERTEIEWRSLAKKAGWILNRIYPLRNAWPSAIEFIPDLSATEGLEHHEEARSSTAIVASMRFLEPWTAEKGIPFIRTEPEPGYNRVNFEWRDYAVTLQDARRCKPGFDLDKHGFAYFDDEISQDVVSTLRQNGTEKVKELYYQHVVEFVKTITGARDVIIFDHTLRKRRLDLSKTSNDNGREQPATMVHCDQSESSAVRRLKDNIDDGQTVEEILKGRVQILNIWRPLNGPVQDWPLATMDYQSVEACNMHPVDLLKGQYEVRGQTVAFEHSGKQRWYYLHKQQTSEVTVIKIWDNKTDGVSKYCPHAAFLHPDTLQGVEPRESVEVRCLVIY